VIHVRSFSGLCSATAVCAFMAFAAVHADGPPTTPAEMQKARHDHYHELGEANKVVRDEARASSPDFDALQSAAEAIHKASINQAQWFPKGTGPEAGKTRALPEIWSKAAEFSAAQQMFSERTPKLLAAVRTRDLASVRSAFREVGAACKNCHDNFRSPDEH
jgi:cytochrome c556